MDSRAFRKHLSLAWQALGAAPKTPHRHDHPTYSEAELLSRADEFNRNAERHWQSIANEPDARLHVMNKPLSTVRDTPAILYRLGLVLHELDLGVGMTVVDFGSGSCWLSSMINRLRCRTISVDVSETALAFGRRMFEADPRHQMSLEPRFVVYSGHVLDIESASVDRIVCFDSFHHVPNQAEVLREFFRVLRPGGRVVMGEPGEGHAHSDQGAYETDIHGVLENDLHLDDLMKLALAAGFHSPHLKPFPEPDALRFTLDQHVKFMEGDDLAFPIDQVRESLRQFMVLSLQKGESVPDSRNPRTLRADIRPLSLTPREDGSGTMQRLKITNTGDTRWLREPTPIGGFVALGAHLLNLKRENVGRGFVRVYLPKDVEPGETVEMEIRLPRKKAEGDCLIQLDLVDDRVAWFEQTGSKTLTLDDRFELATSESPGFLFANLEILAPPPEAPLGPLDPGAAIDVRLHLHNSGDTTWLKGAPGTRGRVCIGVVICDEGGKVLVRDHERFELPTDMSPVDRREIAFTCHTPKAPGRYRLQFDLVDEGITWFESYGVHTPHLSIQVTEAKGH
jgi:SAM-dependent methyltransferase